MKKTLLEKAKEVELKNERVSKYSDFSLEEKIELIFAWANREIRATQFSKAIGVKITTGTYLYVIANFFKEGVRAGIIIKK